MTDKEERKREFQEEQDALEKAIEKKAGTCPICGKPYVHKLEVGTFDDYSVRIDHAVCKERSRASDSIWYIHEADLPHRSSAGDGND